MRGPNAKILRLSKSILAMYKMLYKNMASYPKISTTLMRLALQWGFVQQPRLLREVTNIVVHISYSLGIANGLRQSRPLMQWDGPYLHILSLRLHPLCKKAGLILFRTIGDLI